MCVCVCVCVCVCREREREVYFKELAHVIVRVGNSKFCRQASRLETWGC